MADEGKLSRSLQGSPTLEQLSSWATPGLWKHGFAHWGRIQIDSADRNIGSLNTYAGLGGRETELNAEQDANARFIVALVNAYRSGELKAARSEKQESDAELGRKLREMVNAGRIDVRNIMALFPNLRQVDRSSPEEVMRGRD